MEQITLHVYQSIDGCPVIADKCFNAVVDACAYVLIDEETYLRIYLNDLDWPLEAKETLVVTNGCIDLTETERVRFVRGNVVTELQRMATVWWWLTEEKPEFYSWTTGWQMKS